ncbi:MAG: Mammalian cell entry related domain protein [Gemmatimonadetes bacterium]|nr:Mammalian cell entry related domain protein [Gemmatimonadota bacterium]
MARRTTWKDLIIGLLAVCAILGVGLSILVFGRPGRLHGKTVSLFATSDAARGVIGGTEVWLDGQKVGLVTGIVFRPPSTKPSERLVISMDVLDDALSQLRLDSKVDIRSGTSIIGDQVVYLSSGTAKMRQVLPGDTIHGGIQADVEEVTSDVALASREFPGILENVKLLAAQLQTAKGTLGALGIEKGGPEIAIARMKSTRLVSRAFSSRGTLGLAMRGSGALQARAAAAMTQVDSIRALLASNDHSLGRFRRDSTLVLEITRVRSELADVQRLAESPTGTVGRMRTDSVIVRNIHRDIMSLDSLFAAVKQHPFRYIVF